MSHRIDPARLKSIGVLYEDDELLVVNKPAGMAVHGGAGETGRTVLELLEEAYAPKRQLFLAHRLDRATSGVLLVAKSKDVTRAMAASWDAAEKTYLVVVRGEYRGPATIDRPLKDEDGILRPATTHVVVAAALGALAPATTLLAVKLGTGRMHQIRRHLVDVGHPVMLDDKHGDFAANKAWVRAIKDTGARAPHKADLMLHAARLTCPHPRTRAMLDWTAPPPLVWGHALRAAGASAELLAAWGLGDARAPA